MRNIVSHLLAAVSLLCSSVVRADFEEFRKVAKRKGIIAEVFEVTTEDDWNLQVIHLTADPDRMRN